VSRTLPQMVAFEEDMMCLPSVMDMQMRTK